MDFTVKKIVKHNDFTTVVVEYLVDGKVNETSFSTRGVFSEVWLEDRILKKLVNPIEKKPLSVKIVSDPIVGKIYDSVKKEFK